LTPLHLVKLKQIGLSDI